MKATRTFPYELRWLVTCAAALTCAVAARADEVTVRTVRDGTIHGTLASFSLEDGLRLRTTEGDVVPIGTREIVHLRRPKATQARAAVTVRLADGSLLAGDLLGGAEGTLRVRHAWLGDITVTLEDVRIIQAGAAPTEDPDADERPSLDDVIVMHNGDRRVGTLLGVREGALWMETEFGETLVPLDVFSQVRLAVLSRQDDRPAGLRARLRLGDGSLLTAERVEWKDGSLAVRTRGHEATIPADALGEIDIIGGRWVWLSSLTPARVEQTPLWSVVWPMRVDENVRGGPLQVDGAPYEHGIGVHSACRLVYRLEGAYQTFTVVPGVDDDAGPFADVTVRVLVDGAVRFEHEHLKAGQTPGRIRIGVDGASTLELDVQYGDYGDVQDRFDWADAALIRR